MGTRCPAPFPSIRRRPLAPGGLERIDAARSILLVGTGLTMVDVVLALDHPGRSLTAVSRTGRLPRAHRITPAPPVAAPAELERCPDFASMVTLLDAHIARCRSEHGDWRPAIDGLRSATARLWQRLSDEERTLAVRERSSWWNRHRHRMAPQVEQRLGNMINAGTLDVLPGEVRNAGETPDGLRIELQDGRVLVVDAVVNCTGQQSDMRSVADPLIRSMLRTGIARPGPAGLGLDTDATGRILDRDGHPAEGLYTLGATRIGQLWESTAIPEIREQAAAVGATLADLLCSG